MNFAQQVQAQAMRQYAFAKQLTKCVTIAQSVGVMADTGRQYSIPADKAPPLVGAIQCGEYIMTGKIPSPALVRDCIQVTQ